jgi:hypothetical protein
MDQSILNRIATKVAEGEVSPQIVEDTLTLQGPFKPYSGGDEAEVDREDLTITSPGPEFANDEDGYHLFYLDCEFNVESAERQTHDSPGDPGGVYLSSYEVVAIDGFILLNPEDKKAAKEKLELSRSQQQKLESDYAENISDEYEPSGHEFW